MSLALVLTQSVRVAPLALLTVLLFRCRGWFGVKHGRAWSTMLREGWWALLITLVAEGGIALYSALLLRGS